MQYYAIIGYDANESTTEQRQPYRPAHVERVKALQDEGRLMTAGPFPTADGQAFTGSLIVAKFADQASAEDWAKADPYCQGGIYTSVDVRPFDAKF